MSKRSLHFTPQGWQDYLYWQQNDKKITKKINRLLEESARTPFFGIGKPEPLKEDLAGAWSRRIDDQHRLMYIVTDSEIRISSCRYHYAND
jgi:toxin YoeB